MDTKMGGMIHVFDMAKIPLFVLGLSLSMFNVGFLQLMSVMMMLSANCWPIINWIRYKRMFKYIKDSIPISECATSFNGKKIQKTTVGNNLLGRTSGNYRYCEECA